VNDLKDHLGSLILSHINYVMFMVGIVPARPISTP